MRARITVREMYARKNRAAGFVVVLLYQEKRTKSTPRPNKCTSDRGWRC